MLLKVLPKSLFLASVLLFYFASIVFANGEDVHEEVKESVILTLEDIIRSNSLKIVFFASLIIIIAVVLTVLLKGRGEGIKRVLFTLIVVPTLIATIFMVGSTLYLNFTSSTGGPVHWHADFEIWDCGQELDIVDPKGLSNKVGTSTFHEHGDKRIHVEGVVVEKQEASLGRFFEIIGGKISNDELHVPTTFGLIDRHNGGLCPDGSLGTVQVFVYQTKNGVFAQQKISNPASYILSPESSVPPGDCIIVEFGAEKERTDKPCGSYKVQQQLDKIRPAQGQTIEPDEEAPNLDTPVSTPSSETDHHEEEVGPHGH